MNTPGIDLMVAADMWQRVWMKQTEHHLQHDSFTTLQPSHNKNGYL